MTIDKLEVTAEKVTEDTPIKLIYLPVVPDERLVSINSLKTEIAQIDDRLNVNQGKLDSAIAYCGAQKESLLARKNDIIDTLVAINNDKNIAYDVTDIPAKVAIKG